MNHQRRANGLGSVFYDNRSKRWIAQIVIGKSFTPDMKIRFHYKRKSFAKRTVVSGFIFTPVRPGTLYITIGSGLTSAIALKC